MRSLHRTGSIDLSLGRLIQGCRRRVDRTHIDNAYEAGRERAEELFDSLRPAVARLATEAEQAGQGVTRHARAAVAGGRRPRRRRLIVATVALVALGAIGAALLMRRRSAPADAPPQET